MVPKLAASRSRVPAGSAPKVNTRSSKSLRISCSFGIVGLVLVAVGSLARRARMVASACRSLASAHLLRASCNPAGQPDVHAARGNGAKPRTKLAESLVRPMLSQPGHEP